MAHHPFQKLREQMTPEQLAQADVVRKEMMDEMLTEIRTRMRAAREDAAASRREKSARRKQR